MVRVTASISLVCALVAAPAASQTRNAVRSFEFQNVELRTALDSLVRWYNVPLLYLERDVEGKRVTTDCRACNFEEALREILAGKALFALMVGEQVLLQVRRDESASVPGTLAGTIVDSIDGEPLIGASVVVRHPESERVVRWGTTNTFGFFSLPRLDPGMYVLEVRSVGYISRQQVIPLAEAASPFLRIALTPQEFSLPEVIVEAERSALGTSEGISRGIFMRGTPTDQHQYFLEGTRIYNPQHYGGVLSTFNADALRDVQMVAGGIPPFYGGRIGSILDVTLKSGTPEGLSGSANVGTLHSSLAVNGPMSPSTGFLLSARQSYPNIFLPTDNEHAPSDLRSFEMMTKIHHALSSNGRLSLSAYLNRDSYLRSVPGGNGRLFSSSLRWGNAAFHLRWVDVFSPSLFVHGSLGYTRYAFDIEQRIAQTFVLPERYLSDYAIEDIALRAHAEYYYDEQHTMRAGAELVRHNLGGLINTFSSQLAPLSLAGIAPWELSVYLQDQWRLTPSLTAEIGARTTSFVGRQGTFSSFDPRFSVLVGLQDNLHLYSSFTSITQFIHPYRHSGVFLSTPALFFYPSTETVRPTTSLLLSVGMVAHTPDQEYTFTAEGYYRLTQKLHEFAFDTTRAITGEITDALLFGEGLVYGAEASITKRLGPLTGMLRYSLSFARNRFSEINSGRPYTPQLHRMHELFISFSYVPKEDWVLGLMCLVVPQKALPRDLRATVDAPVSNEVRRIQEFSSAEFTRFSDHIDLNGGRLPGFQRLEMRMARRFTLWGVSCQAALRLVSGYGIVDPFELELRDSYDQRLRWRALLEPPDLLPLYPIVSVGVRF